MDKCYRMVIKILGTGRLISTYPYFLRFSIIQMPLFLTPVLTPIIMIYNGLKRCKMT